MFSILGAMEDVMIFAYVLRPEIKVSAARHCFKRKFLAAKEKIASGRCDYMACEILKGRRYAYFYYCMLPGPQSISGAGSSL
ncbi:hypothetical protein [Janthinobacterium sp. 78]|jgi:hypothetical protein|uniref:hypothetical protein n=1 Tax=Janthinobacterium sp. 78 TaxID=2135631 RepID=UPI0010581675|nr:hypothetical protein [Janthinobacterium sp. 78]